jgi:hypothetical protein
MLHVAQGFAVIEAPHTDLSATVLATPSVTPRPLADDTSNCPATAAVINAYRRSASNAWRR